MGTGLRSFVLWKMFRFLLLLFCVCQATKNPVFLVTCPAVMQTNSEFKLCINLVYPKEDLVVTVSLADHNQKMVLFHDKMRWEYHHCVTFKAPLVAPDTTHDLTVELKGPDFYAQEKRPITFVSQHVTFIRTEQIVYRQGETVNFRIASMDANTTPISVLYDTVEIQEPVFHTIAKWANITVKDNIIQLSHHLHYEAKVGRYRITARRGDAETKAHFTVIKRTIPKFGFSLIYPKTFTQLLPEMKVGICGSYANGKPLAGTAQLQLCYGDISTSSQVCRTQLLNINTAGCAVQACATSQFPSGRKDGFLEFHATVTEQLTGVSQQKRGNIRLTSSMGTFTFVNAPKSYYASVPFEGQVKGVYYNNTPVAHTQVGIVAVHSASEELLQTVTTDGDGMASFSVNITAPASLTLKANVGEAFKGLDHTAHLEKIQNKANSLVIWATERSLQCGVEHQVRVHYTIVGVEVNKRSVDLFYLVISKGLIQHFGRHTVPLEKAHVTEGKVSIPLSVTPSLSTEISLLVYFLLPSGEMVAQSATFSTEVCFTSKVSVQFSSSWAVPSKAVDLQISAEPNSICSMTVMDWSVPFLQEPYSLKPDKINTWLPDIQQLYTNVKGSCKTFQEAISAKKYENSPLYVFMNLGLSIVTNLPLERPPCINEKMQTHNEKTDHPEEDEERPHSLVTYTWLTGMTGLPDSGFTSIPLTVPNRITTWETEIFCLSSKGLGIAAPSRLKVSRPFLLEVFMPPSIKLGEVLEISATVSIFLPKCMRISVTAEVSSHYSLEPHPDNPIFTCLCNETSFRWTLTPRLPGVTRVTLKAEAYHSEFKCDRNWDPESENGLIHVVPHSLKVTAVGPENTPSQVYDWLLCPNGASQKQEAEINLTVHSVPRFQRVFFRVSGDISALARHDLERHLYMPQAGGEHTAALMSPSICALEYLRDTRQEPPPLQISSDSIIKTIYQQIVRFRHVNGAFSNRGTGIVVDTWLTAFIMSTLSRARPFVYVDPEVIREAQEWLLGRQKLNGCFENAGEADVVEGENNEVPLTAFITASLLQLNMTPSSPAVDRSLKCLREASSDLTNTYTAALLAYIFSLAGEVDTRSRILRHLDSVASREGGFLHWSIQRSGSDSLSMETTAYVLLAVLKEPQIPSYDMNYATRIAGWLVKHKYCCEGSTRRVAVALQALTRFSTLAFKPGHRSSVTVQTPSGDISSFTVDQSNRAESQKQELLSARGKYVVKAAGDSCVSVQMAVEHNLSHGDATSLFTATARTEGSCRNKEPLHLHLSFHYERPQKAYNVAIMEVEMLSGFTLDPKSLELPSNSSADRIGVALEGDRVFLYKEMWKKNTYVNITLIIRQEILVQKLKPATVKVYSHYNKCVYGYTEYTSVCAQD